MYKKIQLRQNILVLKKPLSERSKSMANLNQSEFNSIRELVASQMTTSTKLCNYSEQCQDSQIKQMFKQASDQAHQSSQNLLQML